MHSDNSNLKLEHLNRYRLHLNKKSMLDSHATSGLALRLIVSYIKLQLAGKRRSLYTLNNLKQKNRYLSSTNFKSCCPNCCQTRNMFDKLVPEDRNYTYRLEGSYGDFPAQLWLRLETITNILLFQNLRKYHNQLMAHIEKDKRYPLS